MRRHPQALLLPPRDDTAEMDRLRHQLAVLTQRYQELFDGAPVACLVTDLAGTIREANRRATRARA